MIFGKTLSHERASKFAPATITLPVTMVTNSPFRPTKATVST